MQLRTMLLLLSVTMVGFCLTLYFQSETVDHMSWDQYKDLQYTEEPSHSLDDFNLKIAPFKLEDLILEIYERNHFAGEKTRIMEIGTGNGRVLMELKKKFPEVEFYGINKEKSHTFYRRESFALTALKFGIMTKEEIEALYLPYIVFHDLDFGERIPYEENKFDLIFSQNVLANTKYKFELLSEVLRILKPNGLSFQTGVKGINIYSKGIVMGSKEALAEFRKRGIEINLMENPQSLRVKKSHHNTHFPVTPHQPIPDKTQTIPKELRRPDMGYNLI